MAFGCAAGAAGVLDTGRSTPSCQLRDAGRRLLATESEVDMNSARRLQIRQLGVLKIATLESAEDASQGDLIEAIGAYEELYPCSRRRRPTCVKRMLARGPSNCCLRAHGG